MISLEDIITIGGLFLIVGAIFMYYGKVYYSSWMYVFADLCWCINSFYRGDAFGAFTVVLGLLLGIGTMYKMHIGVFHKSIS